MTAPPPFVKHNLFPHQAYHDIAVPPLTPPKRYAALHTDAFCSRRNDIVIATFTKSGTTWLQNTGIRQKLNRNKIL